MRQVNAGLLGPAPTWPQTPLWAYTGPQGEINPTIHVEKGHAVEIAHTNALPATHPIHGYESWTSVHLHGSASLPQYDGYASDVIKPGQRKVYRYPNQQGARTLWYHDHGVHRTAKNAYAGLAGQYHMHDEMERASGIPTGAYDIPLTIRDALFEQSGVLMWDDNNQSSFMGDVILVNGVPWPVLPVTKRRYRFRILNASISRSFNLSLSDTKAKIWVIATDGGFMPKPVQVTSLKVGMAERYEVIIDFSRLRGQRRDHAEERRGQEQHRLQGDREGHAVQGPARRQAGPEPAGQRHPDLVLHPDRPARPARTTPAPTRSWASPRPWPSSGA